MKYLSYIVGAAIGVPVGIIFGGLLNYKMYKNKKEADLNSTKESVSKYYTQKLEKN